MNRAYSLLGIAFLVMFIGVYFVVERANAPMPEDLEGPIITTPNETENNMQLTLTSPAFEEGEKIPSKYTCDGEDINPELHISGVPGGTESFVLVMDDPDAPGGTWAHWAVYNIPSDVTQIKEGEIGTGSEGINSWGRADYGGPCPPNGEHRYIFRLYAVSGMLNFIKAPTLDEVEVAAKGMEIKSATLMGRYKRINN